MSGGTTAVATTTRAAPAARTLRMAARTVDAGGNAVVDDDDDPAGRVDVGVRSQTRAALAQGGDLRSAIALASEAVTPSAARQRVEHDLTVLVHRPDGQFGLIRRADLVHQHHIEIAVEGIGDHPGHRHPAAGHGQHQRPLAEVPLQQPRPAARAASARSRKTSIGRIFRKAGHSRYSAATDEVPPMRLSLAAALLACCACTPGSSRRARRRDHVAGRVVSRAARWSTCRTPTIAPPSSGRPPTPSGSTSSPTATRPTATTTPPTTSSRRNTAARTWTRRCTSRAARSRWTRCRSSGSSARPTSSTSPPRRRRTPTTR